MGTRINVTKGKDDENKDQHGNPQKPNHSKKYKCQLCNGTGSGSDDKTCQRCGGTGEIG